MKDQEGLPRKYLGYQVGTIGWLMDIWAVCRSGATQVVQEAKTNNSGTLEVVGQRFTVVKTGDLFAVTVEELR